MFVKLKKDHLTEKKGKVFRVSDVQNWERRLEDGKIDGIYARATEKEFKEFCKKELKPKAKVETVAKKEKEAVNV